jgi:uracil-DNA glycosylase family 4
VKFDLSKLADCARCPRLAAHHAEVRERHPHYHAAPVGAWGDPRARLLIVGLAPGLHGATRTGRAFVGDASGEFLFAALHRQGFATDATPDQAALLNTRITNVVKCLPPGNAPKGSEVQSCMGYLQAELNAFCPAAVRKPRVVLTLGGVAHRAVCRALQVKGAAFSHGGTWRPRQNLLLLSSFHPSQLNVNTKRLTADMLDAVLASAGACLD